jgi:AcrR family transcriptional regulator
VLQAIFPPSKLEGVRINGRVTRESATQREAFLDAAAICVERYGLRRTTMSQVAEVAGVHRTSLYRYFTDRNELIVGLLVREAVPICARSARTMAKSADIPGVMAESLATAVLELRASPQLAAIFLDASPVAASQLVEMSSELDELARIAVMPSLVRADEKGMLRPAITIIDGTNWIKRIVLNFTTDSTAHTYEEYRRLFAVYVIPALFADQTADV